MRVIDSHAHVTAPGELYAYKAGLLAHRGAHGRGKVNLSDEQIIGALNAPTFGTVSHLEQLEQVGTDMQLVSPRPYTMMHSEKPEKLVRWYIEEVNSLIHRQCQLFPDIFRGVAGLPQNMGESPENSPVTATLTPRVLSRHRFIPRVHAVLIQNCSLYTSVAVPSKMRVRSASLSQEKRVIYPDHV